MPDKRVQQEEHQTSQKALATLEAEVRGGGTSGVP